MQALRTGWDFFQNEVLGMKWLNRLIGSILEACGLDLTSKVGGSIQFFIYDVIKIMVLLGVLILLISYIQSYFPPERTKRILGRFHGIGANCVAALLGTVTPFCSCSSIPLFIGFTSAVEMSRNVQSGNTQNLKSSAAPVRLPAAPAPTLCTLQAAAPAGCACRP